MNKEQGVNDIHDTHLCLSLREDCLVDRKIILSMMC